MSTVAPPNAREIQEFQFKLLARLRLSRDNPQLPLKQSLSLVSVASRFGLIFVGTPNGFDVIQTVQIVEKCAGSKKPAAEISDFPRRSVLLGVQPSHLDISCDCQHLAVGYSLDGAGVIRIYDVTSLVAQTERLVMEVRLLAPLHALSCNPGIPNFLAACMQDGSAVVYEFKDNSFDISSIPADAQATCFCWSPKGKQIVIGSRNGTLNQFKPDLKIVKAIPPPQGNLTVVSVHWLSNLQYVAVYCQQGTGPSLVVINTPRNQPITYINYEDITYSNGDNRLTQFYFIHQQTWNVLLVGSANSMEVGVLGLQGEWEQWQLEDTARAELPLSTTKQETHPVGMALDTSVQYNLPWGENQQLPAMPLLVLLSHEGLLTLYWTVNLIPGSASVCKAPTPLPDTSGLHLFISPEPQPEVKTPVQSVVTPQPVTPVLCPVQPVSFTPSTATNLQQPPPSLPPWTPTSSTIVPKPENKPPPISAVQGSWLASSSTATPAFMSSITQSAFTAASPAFSPTSSTAPPSAFSATSAVPSLFNVSSAPQTQTPFSFAPLQTSDMFSKPGGFLSSSTPSLVNPVTASTVAPIVSTPVKTEVLSVPAPVPSPVSTPSTPEVLPTAEITAESQELKAMNDALIVETIREKVTHFDQWMKEHGQRIHSFNTNEINGKDLENLCDEVNNLTAFMKELKETTAVQDNEVKSLRSLLLEEFSYLEHLKTRRFLQSNPDYMSVKGWSQGLDPILKRKLARIKSNIQLIERQLANLNSELHSRWTTFQDSSKENRHAIMQTPSLECVYQAMVMHNSLLMGQKNLVEQLELKVRAHSHKNVANLIKVTQMIDANQLNVSSRETEISKISQDFLNLNFKKGKTENLLEKLQSTISSFNISEHSFSSTNDLPAEIFSEKMALLEQVFSEIGIKRYKENNLLLNSDYSQQDSVLPVVTSTPRIGSISSGQPVIQSSTPKTSTAVKDAVKIPLINRPQSSFLKESVKSSGESKNKSLFSMPNTVTPMSFDMGSSKSQVSHVTTPSLSITSKSSQLSPQTNIVTSNTNVQTSSANKQQHSSTNIQTSNFSFGGITPQNVSTSSQVVLPTFNSSSTTIVTPPVTTQQTVFGTPTSSGSKAFSFVSLATSQPSYSFFPSSSLESSVVTTQFPPPSLPQSFSAFLSTTVSSSAATTSTFTPSFGKSESPKTLPNSTVTSPLKTTSPENIVTANVSNSPPPTSSSPLASLSYLVSGIEPLRPSNEPSGTLHKTQVSSETSTTKVIPNQPFVFKVPNFNEKKVSSPVKETGIFTQKTNVFENKQDSKESVANTEQKGNSNEIKSQLGGAFKNLSFDSPTKTIFGGAPPLTPPGTGAGKSDQIAKNLFGISNTHSTSTFDTGNVTTFSQCQKSVFAGGVSSSGTPSATEQQGTPVVTEKTKDPESENISPIIEVTLTPSKRPSDRKTSLEKLSEAKDITITKVESLEKKTVTEGIQSEGDSTPAALLDSLNLSTFSTPAKSSQNIFGVSSTDLPTYQIEKSEEQIVSSLEEQTDENKLVETDKQPETTKSQSSFGGTAVTPPATSFSFSTSTLQNPPPSAESTQPQENSAFSFGLHLSTDSVSPPNTATTTTSSTFGFTQAAQPPSTGFSFALPATSTTTTTTSTFSFNNLTTGFSGDKSKTGFSFGQTQSPASAPSSVFGGFTSKPSETSSIFGQTNTSSGGENKGLFGQTPSSTAETQNIFGQSPTKAVDTKSVFEQSSTTTAETKNIFGQTPTTTAETKNIFGQTPTTTAETKNIFGQTPTTTAETKNIFGQTPTTAAETKNIFGQMPTTTAETKNIFGQMPTTTAETKNIFGQTPTTTAETKNIFGQMPTTTAETKNIFGQTPTTTAETKNIFGQTTATSVDAKPEFSFSLSQSNPSTQTSFFGTPVSTTASFFGQPICSPTSTANSPFGQPSSTPVFGTASPSPFGGTSAFGNKSTFGQSGGSFFGQTSGGFGSSSGSLFGGGSSSLFGSSSQQATSPFGQSPGGGTGSIFGGGGGSFSGGGQAVGQTGFGTSAFQNKPAAFGSSPPAFGAAPAFGGAPTFGASPAFGSPPKPFGSPPPTSQSAFGTTQQQSSTFENLANQNTMTFGNLAQNQPSGFGSMFPSNQSNTPAPAFSPPSTTSSVFGGSSFTSWR